jgi:hypothetical protein
MNMRMTSTVLSLAIGLSACSDAPAAPKAAPERAQLQASGGAAAAVTAAAPGTGLVLNSLTGVTVPLIGKLGTVTINQAVITNITLVESTVGNIVGLRVNGVLDFTASALGTQVLTQNFTTTATVTPGGGSACNVLTVALGPITISALAASIQVPTATVTADSSGLVGQLLCTIARLLNSVGGGNVQVP